MDDIPDSNPAVSNDETPSPSAPRVNDNPLVQIGLYLIALSLVVLAGYLAWQRFYPVANVAQTKGMAAQASSSLPNATIDPQGSEAVALLPYTTPTGMPDGIRQLHDPQTIIPGRPREDVISYTVQLGDNLFAIADIFGLKPETVLWGNYATLKDNPEILMVDQELNILPVDGTYYQWQQGDTLKAVAEFFKADPQDVLDYPGNHIDLTTVVDGEPVIDPGTWLIIPGGKRALKDWGPPAITRSNPAVARYYGPGSCGAVYEGAIGSGVFVWPTTEHLISGYSYSAIHPAIDIGGAVGNAVYASDSGVVVYAGWSNYGYGNLIVIDHGNGWQTAYAHLSSIGVGCGQSVSRGIMIGGLGSTGNSTGPHLHFEMGINGVKVNPLDYVQ